MPFGFIMLVIIIIKWDDLVWFTLLRLPKSFLQLSLLRKNAYWCLRYSITNLDDLDMEFLECLKRFDFPGRMFCRWQRLFCSERDQKIESLFLIFNLPRLISLKPNLIEIFPKCPQFSNNLEQFSSSLVLKTKFEQFSID